MRLSHAVVCQALHCVWSGERQEGRQGRQPEEEARKNKVNQSEGKEKIGDGEGGSGHSVPPSPELGWEVSNAQWAQEWDQKVERFVFCQPGSRRMSEAFVMQAYLGRKEYLTLSSWSQAIGLGERWVTNESSWTQLILWLSNIPSCE